MTSNLSSLMGKSFSNKFISPQKTVYRTNAIILSISRIRDNQTRIVVISQDYGKITGWWNKKNITGIDLWDIVELLISRDGGKNNIKGIDIRTPGWSRNWNYIRIVSFLETLRIIGKMSVEWVECRWLYEDISEFIRYGKTEDMHSGHHTVFQMRLLKSLGSMDRTILGADPILGYIYDNISHTPLNRILSSINIKTEHISQIQKINLHSLYMLEQ